MGAYETLAGQAMLAANLEEVDGLLVAIMKLRLAEMEAAT